MQFMIKIVTVTCLLASCVGVANANSVSVRDFGAVGDGVAKDTAAIQKALDAGASDVTVPAGTYLIGSIVLHSHTTLHVDQGATLLGSDDPADYPMSTARWEGRESPVHQALIHADHADQIAIVGSGTIQGGAKVGALRNPRAPTIIEPIECHGVRVEGVTLKSTRIWTLHPTYCRDVVISGVHFDTTGWNSDGIDPDSCQHVRIEHCTFSTGDDNIAIKSGKGQEGERIARPCEDILITDCTFVKGYSSIAMGSELSGGIRHVRVARCTFLNGKAALYLKSRDGRGGYIEDVEAHDLDTKIPVLEITSHYNSNPDNLGIPGFDGLTYFRNVRVSHVKADCDTLVTVDVTLKKPVNGLEISDITGVCKKGIVLKNARDVKLRAINVTGFTGPLILVDNAEGVGLEAAQPLPPPVPKASL